MANIVQRWQCGECDTVHPSQIMAMGCCVEVYDAYECTDCGKIWIPTSVAWIHTCTDGEDVRFLPKN